MYITGAGGDDHDVVTTAFLVTLTVGAARRCGHELFVGEVGELVLAEFVAEPVVPVHGLTPRCSGTPRTGAASGGRLRQAMPKKNLLKIHEFIPLTVFLERLTLIISAVGISVFRGPVIV
jgi:hypothetical protein